MTRMGRSDRGSASIELMGVLHYLLLAALLAWQLLLVATTVTAAENAARTGSRAGGLGDNAVAAATDALPDWLSRNATAISAPGSNSVRVSIRVPIIVPGLASDTFVVSRDAHLP